jgi:hypothetical protein
MINGDTCDVFDSCPLALVCDRFRGSSLCSVATDPPKSETHPEPAPKPDAEQKTQPHHAAE